MRSNAADLRVKLASFEGPLDLLLYLTRQNEIDIRDRIGLAGVFQFYQGKIKLIIHLAALKSIPESIEYPDLYQEVNVTGTKNLIDLATQYGVPKFVFSSTAAVYAGPPPVKGYSETDVAELDSLGHNYAKSKRQCELLLEKASQNHNITVVTLRYFNPIGNHESGFGDLHTCVKAHPPYSAQAWSRL